MSDKFTRVVIGTMRASRQDLSKLVGTMSREHVASDEARTDFLTSSGEAGKKLSRSGGGDGGAICTEAAAVVKAEQSLETLSPTFF